MGDLNVEVALHLRAEHAEGPIWDAISARLWWVDITGERVHCLDPTSGAASSWPTHGQAGGVVIDIAGDPVVATPAGLAVLDRTTGSMAAYVSIEADRPENRANDAKVDTSGRVWVGTMAFDKRPGNAALYRVEGDTATRVVEGLTISNGPAFDDAGGRLYLADTALGIVDVFDFDPTTGRVGTRRRFLDFGDDGVWPDGMTVDDDGMLWVARRAGRCGPPLRQRGQRSTPSLSSPRQTPRPSPSEELTVEISTSRLRGSTSSRTTVSPSRPLGRSTAAGQASPARHRPDTDAPPLLRRWIRRSHRTRPRQCPDSDPGSPDRPGGLTTFPEPHGYRPQAGRDPCRAAARSRSGVSCPPALQNRFDHDAPRGRGAPEGLVVTFVLVGVGRPQTRQEPGRMSVRSRDS